jgi:hypothetical protein
MPPVCTPLSGIECSRRYPSGETEKAKYTIQTFFILRNLFLKLKNVSETQLPLTRKDSLVKENDSLDLSRASRRFALIISKLVILPPWIFRQQRFDCLHGEHKRKVNSSPEFSGRTPLIVSFVIQKGPKILSHRSRAIYSRRTGSQANRLGCRQVQRSGAGNVRFTIVQTEDMGLSDRLAIRTLR